MTSLQLYAAVGGIGDDLVTRASAAASARSRKTRRPMAVAASVAACLLIALIAAIWVQIDTNRFVASCGGSAGTLVEGTYYFYDINSGFYAYDPATGETECLVSEYFHDLEGVRVNAYGTYYTTGGRLDLVVRIHETGKTVTLLRADPDEYTHARIAEIYEDTVLYTLYNKDLAYRTTLLLDARTGEVLETLRDHQPYEEDFLATPYPVGDRNIALKNDASHPLRHLVEDGEAILMEGYELAIGDEYGHNRYAGESLIAHFYQDNEDGSSTRHFVLLRPSGENILIRNAFIVVGGTDDYLFGRPADADLRTLWTYHIATGEVTLLIEDYRMQEITTDGTHLYATAPWSSHADVYRLDYNRDGTLAGVTLTDTIGE